MTLRYGGFDGIKLAADVGGDPADPAVLLLPGFGQTRAAWARAAKALVAAGRYVVTIDHRGHGESDWCPRRRYEFGDIVRDVAAVIAQMPSQPAVVGAGLGGLAALVAIGEQPDDPIAKALVLVDAAPRMSREGIDRLSALMTTDAEGSQPSRKRRRRSSRICRTGKDSILRKCGVICAGPMTVYSGGMSIRRTTVSVPALPSGAPPSSDLQRPP